MLHLWNKRFHYNNLKRVTDKSGARHYSLDGHRVPSVTTILEKTKSQKEKDSLMLGKQELDIPRLVEYPESQQAEGIRCTSILRTLFMGSSPLILLK